MAFAVVAIAPGLGSLRALAPDSQGRFTQQAVQGQTFRHLIQRDLAAQHEHAQPLEHGGQYILAADQQIGAAVGIMNGTQRDKTRLHAAFGIAECRQAGLVGLEQGKIVGELRLQETRGVGAVYADHAPGAVCTAQWHHAIGQGEADQARR